MTAAVAAVTPLPAARTAVGLLVGYDAFVDTLPISSWQRSVRRPPPDGSSRSTVIWWDG